MTLTKPKYAAMFDSCPNCVGMGLLVKSFDETKKLSVHPVS